MLYAPHDRSVCGRRPIVCIEGNSSRMSVFSTSRPYRSRAQRVFSGGRPAHPTVSIVIPALNEARNLEIILPTLPDVHEVILVDGNSTDDTVDTAIRVMPEIRVVRQSRKGKGNALVAGFEAATGDIIVMFDADGSADSAEIPDFIEALVAGADFAKGSRNLGRGGSEDITKLRNLGNSCLNGLANILFATDFTDLCYGYNAFWRDILGSLELPPSEQESADPNEMLWGDGFEIETLLNCRVAAAGLVVHEVASVERLRVHGISNLNAASDGWRVLRTMLVEHRRYRGRHSRRKSGTGTPPRPVDVVVDLRDAESVVDLAQARGELAESKLARRRSAAS